jgi:hypothetical protein
MTEKPTNVANPVIPTKEELKKAADTIPVAKLKNMKRVHIKCELFAELQTADEAEMVSFVGGEMVVYKGDWVLYLGDGHPFTVMQKDTFPKRCVELDSDEVIKVSTKKATGERAKIKQDADGNIKKTKAKPKKRRITDKTSEGITKLATKMNADGCDVARFTRETAGTPIDAAIWGKVAEWNKKKDLEKIVRVGIGKEDTHFEGEFIAQTLDYSGTILRSIRYYKVCADRGIWTRLSEQDEAKAEKAFENKDFQVQYAKAEINRIYNYGDPSVKKYDDKMMECKTMAQEAYALRKGGKKEEARPKYQDIYNKCRNQVLNEYNRNYLIEFNELVRKHRDDNKALTWAEARKEVKKDLLEKAAKMVA